MSIWIIETTKNIESTSLELRILGIIMNHKAFFNKVIGSVTLTEEFLNHDWFADWAKGLSPDESINRFYTLTQK